jgi:hypothetical protein
MPAPPAGRTTPQANEATGTDRGETSYARLRLPHERDEDRTSMAAGPQPVIERAARDLAEGQRDTDCYGQARLNFQRRNVRRRRK